jgi:hypothetical protein
MLSPDAASPGASGTSGGTVEEFVPDCRIVWRYHLGMVAPNREAGIAGGRPQRSLVVDITKLSDAESAALPTAPHLRPQEA